MGECPQDIGWRSLELNLVKVKSFQSESNELVCALLNLLASPGIRVYQLVVQVQPVAVSDIRPVDILAVSLGHKGHVAQL